MVETFPDVALVDTLPGLPTKVRDLTGRGDFFALVWQECTCYDMEDGEFKMNKAGFICPVHLQGEVDKADHCYCGYGNAEGKPLHCQIHALNSLTVDELDLLALWIDQAIKSSGK